MTLYLDCTAGISGDRLLAALLDLGFPLQELRRLLRLCGIPQVRIRMRRVLNDGLRATQVQIEEGNPPFLPPRRAGEWITFLERSKLPVSLKQSVARVVRTLAAAEGKVHHRPWNKVIFHQLRAVDTLVYFIGFCAALKFFQVRSVYASPVSVGSRFRDHSGRWKIGIAPATKLLLRRFPTVLREGPFEFSTPTGAALLASFGCDGALPSFQVAAIGHGIQRGGRSSFLPPLRIIAGKPLFFPPGLGKE